MPFSNYPPGVTGSEYQISGPDREQAVEEESCPKCEEDTIVEEFYGEESRRYCTSSKCDWSADWEPLEDNFNGDATMDAYYESKYEDLL